MSKTVLVPIADGIEEIESATIIDTLRRAGAEVTVASVSSDLPITASRQMKFVADKLIQDCANQSYDLIALPGGLPGAKHLRDCATLIDMLKAQKAAGRLYGAICASPAVALASHGLLDDKQATGYPSTQDKLPNAVADQRVVVDGNCITSQGPGTALEFAIELIRQLFDDAKAKQVADPMVINF